MNREYEKMVLEFVKVFEFGEKETDILRQLCETSYLEGRADGLKNAQEILSDSLKEMKHEA